MASQAQKECLECHRMMPNSYVLLKHMAAKHPKTVTNAETTPVETPPVVAALPKSTLLVFRQAVEIRINGVLYATKPVADKHEMEAPYEVIPDIVRMAKEAYGEAVIVE